MWSAILEIVATLLKVFADWPKRQSEKARKNYANWRAGAELRKEARARRASMARDVDQLRPPESGPK